MTDRLDSKPHSIFLLRVLDVLSSSVLALVILINIWLFASVNPIVWVDNIADDAYYYLGIARSLATHGLFQFLPPFETNGFQPLWQGILAVDGFIFGTSARSMVIECYGMSAIFVAFFVTLSKRWNGSALAGVLVAILFPGIMLSGMETVMIPAFALLFFATTSWKSRGLLGSLIFLGRLDAISLVVARDVYLFIRRRELDLRHYAIILPVAVAYVVFNFWRFGIFLPVSGLAKSLYMTPLENLITAFQYLIWMFPALVLLAVAFVLKRRGGARPIAFKHGAELTICIMAAIVCALYYGSMSGWPLWEWYSWAPMLITYYALLEVIDIAGTDIGRGRYRRVSGTAIAVTAIIFAAGGFNYTLKTLKMVMQAYFHAPMTASFGRKNLELVDWVRSKRLPQGTMFAMGDRAGSFGYFLGGDYRFLHTEGLVADAAYYNALKKDEGLSYVEQQPITYWVAEREQFLQAADVIGVAEPVQGLSMHKGVYLICFDHNAIAVDQSYPSMYSPTHDQNEQRYVFDMKGRVDCPAPLQAQFATLRAGYGNVRAFSLPLQQEAVGVLHPYIKRYLGF